MPFGWVDNAAPYITAANLEMMFAGGPYVFTPESYGAKRDGKSISDATIAGGSLGTVTSAAQAVFTSADTGKIASIAGAGAGGASLTTTLTYVSATSCTISPSATTAVTSVIMNYGTDDTAAINSAITAAITYASDASGVGRDTNYAEVWFYPGMYIINGALQTSQSGYAQIPLPNVSTVGEKMTLVLRGVVDSSALPHWFQNVPQYTGATLCSTLLPSYSGTFGPPSCIGGPTVEVIDSGNAYTANFSNLLVYISGLTVSTPRNANTYAVDLCCIAEANIGSLYCTGSNVPQFATLPTGTGCGLRMPTVGNNDNCNIMNYSCDGYYIGLMASAHMQAFRMALLNCAYGIGLDWPYPNTAHIGYLSTEGCQYHISASFQQTGDPFQIAIDCWDIEDYATISTTYHVDDANSRIGGYAHFFAGLGGDTKPLVNGGTHLRLIDQNQARGHVTAPGVPASTSVYTSTFWRDAAVTIVSGSSTCAIAVDGQALCTLGSGGATTTVMVPSGRSIKLTYSNAPTWQWTLL